MHGCQTTPPSNPIVKIDSEPQGARIFFGSGPNKKHPEKNPQLSQRNASCMELFRPVYENRKFKMDRVLDLSEQHTTSPNSGSLEFEQFIYPAPSDILHPLSSRTNRAFRIIGCISAVLVCWLYCPRVGSSIKRKNSKPVLTVSRLKEEC
jgi:hypothetical protein